MRHSFDGQWGTVGRSCGLEMAAAAPAQVAAIVLVAAKARVDPDPALRDRTVRLLEQVDGPRRGGALAKCPDSKAEDDE